MILVYILPRGLLPLLQSWHRFLPLHLAGESSTPDSFPEFPSLPKCLSFPLLPCYRPSAFYWTNQKATLKNVYKIWCRCWTIRITIPTFRQLFAGTKTNNWEIQSQPLHSAPSGVGFTFLILAFMTWYFFLANWYQSKMFASPPEINLFKSFNRTFFCSIPHLKRAL